MRAFATQRAARAERLALADDADLCARHGDARVQRASTASPRWPARSRMSVILGSTIVSISVSRMRVSPAMGRARSWASWRPARPSAFRARPPE